MQTPEISKSPKISSDYIHDHHQTLRFFLAGEVEVGVWETNFMLQVAVCSTAKSHL